MFYLIEYLIESLEYLIESMFICSYQFFDFCPLRQIRVFICGLGSRSLCSVWASESVTAYIEDGKWKGRGGNFVPATTNQSHVWKQVEDPGQKDGPGCTFRPLTVYYSKHISRYPSEKRLLCLWSFSDRSWLMAGKLADFNQNLYFFRVSMPTPTRFEGQRLLQYRTSWFVFVGLIVDVDSLVL